MRDTNSNWFTVIRKTSNEVKDIARVDQEPSLEGRQLLTVLSPLKRDRYGI